MTGDATMPAPVPRPTASDAVREMRASGRAGAPVAAAQVNAWATALMSLFGEQRAVRLEQWGGSFWYEIDERQWYRALATRERIRALYTQPLLQDLRSDAEKRDHVWSADRSHCVVCNDPYDWADPYCYPPKPPEPVIRERQKFNPEWFVPVLDQLEVLVRTLGPVQRHEWLTQITSLRRAIELERKGI